jgi:hypothetical protein
VTMPYGPKGLTNLCGNAPTVLPDGGLFGSTATLRQTSLPYWSLRGRVRDALNQSDDQGAALRTAITDWHRFEHPYRGWGKAYPIGPDTPNPYDGGIAFYGWPSVESRGPCFGATASCEVFDYALRRAAPPDAGPGAGGGTDVYLRNKLPLPTSSSVVLTHTFRGFYVGTLPCADLPGAVLNPATMRCTVTFLENAKEVIEDGVGNDNGLCESNERCVATPNHGAYQGQGALIPAGTLSAGAITNVSLFTWELNGR